jgi:Nuclear pore complex assembly
VDKLLTMDWSDTATQQAVLYLTQPSLLPVFSSEILATLLKAGEYGLALAYYNAIQPNIEGSELWEDFFQAMCKASITEAFFFMRRQSPSHQKHLLELLIDSALNLPAGEERRKKGLELVDLPFNHAEETWFREYLTSGKGRKLDRAGDTILTRLLALGKYDGMMDTVSEVNASKVKVDGIKWENIVEGVNRGLGERSGLEHFEVDR